MSAGQTSSSARRVVRLLLNDVIANEVTLGCRSLHLAHPPLQLLAGLAANEALSSQIESGNNHSCAPHNRKRLRSLSGRVPCTFASASPSVSVRHVPDAGSEEFRLRVRFRAERLETRTALQVRFTHHADTSCNCGEPGSICHHFVLRKATGFSFLTAQEGGSVFCFFVLDLSLPRDVRARTSQNTGGTKAISLHSYASRKRLGGIITGDRTRQKQRIIQSLQNLRRLKKASST